MSDDIDETEFALSMLYAATRAVLNRTDSSEALTVVLDAIEEHEDTAAEVQAQVQLTLIDGGIE